MLRGCSSKAPIFNINILDRFYYMEAIKILALLIKFGNKLQSKFLNLFLSFLTIYAHLLKVTNIYMNFNQAMC